MGHDIFAFVPARGGSKGLPGKCVRPLNGVPLYLHSVTHAVQAGIGRVVISTDIRAILEADLPQGVTALPRPAEFARDTTPMIDVLLHHLDTHEPADGVMVLLQPTSPLRQAEDIAAGLALFDKGGFDLVMSVREADRGVLKWGLLEGDTFQPLNSPSFTFSNRQALPPIVRPNGAVYVINTGWLRRHRQLHGGRIGCFAMPEARSIDIDTLADFERCAAALSGP